MTKNNNMWCEKCEEYGKQKCKKSRIRLTNKNYRKK